MKEKESMERNRKYKKKHFSAEDDDDESIDSIMSELLKSNKQHPKTPNSAADSLFADIEYKEKHNDKENTKDIIRDLLLDLNLPTNGEAAGLSPPAEEELALNFNLMPDDELYQQEVKEKKNQRSNHELIQTDEFTMVLGNIEEDTNENDFVDNDLNNSFLTMPTYSDSCRTPLDSKKDFISTLSYKHMEHSQESLGDDADAWAYEEDGYGDTKEYSKRIQQKWAIDAKKREMDELLTTPTSDTEKKKKKKRKEKKKKGRKSKNDDKLIKNVEYTLGDMTLTENVMPELDMALELGVNQEELSGLLPPVKRKRKATIKEDDPDKRAVKRVRSTEVQTTCCIKGCTKEVTNRLRFSLRCKEDNDYKDSHINQGWDKVCHYHYFSDLYQHKKKSQKKGDEDMDLDLMTDDVELAKEVEAKAAKAKKKEEKKKKRAAAKKEKVEGDDDEYQPTPPAKRRKRSTKKKDKKDKTKALLEKQLKEAKAELLKERKKFEEERKKLVLEKEAAEKKKAEEKKRRKAKAKKEKKEAKKKKTKTKKKDMMLTKIAMPTAVKKDIKNEPGTDKMKMQQHTSKMQLQSANRMQPTKPKKKMPGASLQITQHVPNGMGSIHNMTTQASTPIMNTSPMMQGSFNTTPINNGPMGSMPMKQHPMQTMGAAPPSTNTHPLAPYISQIPRPLLKAKHLVEDQKRHIYIQRYQIDRQVKFLKKQETAIETKLATETPDGTSDELKKLQGTLTRNQTHLKNQERQLTTMKDHLTNFENRLKTQFTNWHVTLDESLTQLRRHHQAQHAQYRSYANVTPQYLNQLESSHRSLEDQLINYHRKQKENYANWGNFAKPRNKDELDKLFREHEALQKTNKRKA